MLISNCSCPIRFGIDGDDFLVTCVRNGEPVFQVWSFDGSKLKQIVSTDDVTVTLAYA